MAYRRTIHTSVAFSVLFLLCSPLLASELPSCADGKSHHNCFGQRTWDTGDKYVGEWRNNKRHGTGAAQWANGASYVGEWRNNLMHGRGTAHWTDSNSIYFGTFSENLINGDGVLWYSDGRHVLLRCEGKSSVVDCEPLTVLQSDPLAIVKRSKTSACPVGPDYYDDCFGQRRFEEGSRYVGEWKDDNPHGAGIIVASNALYIGKFHEGEMHGSGTLYDPDGIKYVGEFSYSSVDGSGTIYFPGGAKYVGHWENALLNGTGTYWLADGTSQTLSCSNVNNLDDCTSVSQAQSSGNLKACPTGPGYYDNCFGEWVYDNGDRFVGEWHGNAKHGKGTYYYLGGDKYVGNWVSDLYDGSGKYTWEDGSSQRVKCSRAEEIGDCTDVVEKRDKRKKFWKNVGRFIEAAGQVAQENNRRIDEANAARGVYTNYEGRTGTNRSSRNVRESNPRSTSSSGRSKACYYKTGINVFAANLPSHSPCPAVAPTGSGVPRGAVAYNGPKTMSLFNRGLTDESTSLFDTRQTNESFRSTKVCYYKYAGNVMATNVSAGIPCPWNPPASSSIPSSATLSGEG